MFLQENYDRFLRNPSMFHHSLPYFCVVCMISILKKQFGIKYNRAWEHISPDNPRSETDAFAHDAQDQFIHAILDGRGGTCGSLPVFFVAVGRRIGFPLYLVKTLRRLFMRWDDPFGAWSFGGFHRGAVFNIEATGQEIHVLSDEHYRTVWPHPLTAEDIETYNLLKSLTSEEELAIFWRCAGDAVTSMAALKRLTLPQSMAEKSDC